MSEILPDDIFDEDCRPVARTERYVSVSDLNEIIQKWFMDWFEIANETGQNIHSMNGVNMAAVVDDFMHWIGLDTEEGA